MYYGAIEAGGTKFVCAVADQDLNVIKRISIPTIKPEETMVLVFEFFDQYELISLGIGSFGPIDVNKASSTYGHFLKTPKLAWAHYDFVGSVKAHYDVPIGFTTDVNSSALGELHLGAAKGLESCVYITVGTGIGGGGVVKGELLEGLSHPEMGHILVRRHPEDTYEGYCPFHKDCLEGMAAGPAIEDRWGVKAVELPADHQAWEFQAHYLAQAVMSFILTLSPERIILGGGVMKQKHLFPMIREKLTDIMADYLPLPDLETFIVPPGLGDDAGIMGCLIMASEEVKK